MKNVVLKVSFGTLLGISGFAPDEGRFWVAGLALAAVAVVLTHEPKTGEAE